MIILISLYIISVITEICKQNGDALGYSLEPFPLADRTYSNNVFLLTEDGVNPIKEFYQKSRDAVAARKIAAAIGSVSERGIDASRQTKLLRKLEGINNRNDLYEIRVHGCTARAFSFLVNSETIVVVAFIDKMHSGKANNETRRAARKLDAMRSNLEEALENRSNDEQIVR